MSPNHDTPPPPLGPVLQQMAYRLSQEHGRWSKAWEEQHNAPPDCLYHYTDAVGLLGIINSRELWASNAAFLNDSTELRYVRGVLATVAEELVAAHGGYPLVSTQLENMKRVLEAWGDQVDVFVTCFCAKRDLLSQWRGYPPVGGGYALGVATTRLPPGTPGAPFLRRVVYDEGEQHRMLHDLLAPLCAELAAADHGAKSPVWDLGSLSRTPALLVINSRLLECSYCFKHRAFAEEDEWRLVSVWGRNPQLVPRPVFVRSQATGLLPYVKLPLGAIPPIAEVIVGPTAHPNLAASATRRLLESVGYANADEMVTNSEIPLRV